MLKSLLGGAALLALSGHAVMASNIIINGVPHHGGQTVNVPYGAGAGACCNVEELPYTPLPVIHQPAAVPATYTTAPTVTYQAAPVVTYEAAPVVTYEAAPTVTYETAPIVTEQPVVINQAPVAPAPVIVAKPAARGWSSQVYVGARGGWSGIKDTGFGIQGSNVRNDYEDRGYNVAAVVGWGAKVSNSIGYRLEAELGYQTADVDSHRVGGQTFSSQAEGETNTIYGFANAYLDVPLVSRLNAVVGGGLGVGQVEFDGHGIDLPGIGTVQDDEDTVFGYHLDAGLSYDVTDRLALEAMYRYTQFVDVELTSEDGVTSETDVDSHNIVVGARYGF